MDIPNIETRSEYAQRIVIFITCVRTMYWITLFLDRTGVAYSFIKSLCRYRQDLMGSMWHDPDFQNLYEVVTKGFDAKHGFMKGISPKSTTVERWEHSCSTDVERRKTYELLVKIYVATQTALDTMAVLRERGVPLNTEAISNIRQTMERLRDWLLVRKFRIND